MKKMIICLLALLPLSAISRQPTIIPLTDTGIRFAVMPFEEALQAAGNAQKLVFIDFYTVPCGPCILLEKEICPRAMAGEIYNRQFICLRIDVRSEEGKTLAEHYKTGPYPTLLFVDGEGREVFRQIGVENLDDFLRAAEKTQRVRQLIRSMDTVKKHLGNQQFIPEEMYAYSVYLRSNMANMMSENDSANRGVLNLFRAYFATQSYEQLFSESNLNILFNIGEYLDMRSREYHFLLNNRHTFYQYFNEAEVDEKIIVVPQCQALKGLNLHLAEEVLNAISQVAREHKVSFAGYTRYPSKTTKTSTGYFIMQGMPDLFMDLYKIHDDKEAYRRTAIKAINDNKTDYFMLASLAWSLNGEMLSPSGTSVYDAYAKHLAKAPPSGERYPYILGAYGRCLARSGQKEKAIGILERCLGLLKKNNQEFPPAEKLLKELQDNK